MKVLTKIIDLAQPYDMMFTTVEPGEVTADHFCYVESCHLGVGGHFFKQPFEDVMTAVRDCIENGGEDQISEFVIYLAEGVGLYIGIGNVEE